MDASFSYAFRIAACNRCGAPQQAAVTGGSFHCRFCNAQNTLALRSEIVVAPGRAPVAEAERIARLRTQDGKPLLPPPNLAHVMANGGSRSGRLTRRSRSGTERGKSFGRTRTTSMPPSACYFSRW